MKVFIKGKNSVELDKNSFLASGGQADVYRKANLAYKIYHKSSNAIPSNKIFELSNLKLPNVIKPEDILLNQKNDYIGYTMKFVDNTYTLCQLFPKPFRLRTNLTNDHIIKLVRRMQHTISAIHAEKILVVDLNEMNHLVSHKFDEVYFIDVDSYQTPNFPANALMESVRDRHSTKFSELTDWFAFGIVSFQMFRGIHPYKGKHSTYHTLDERMLHNISIFHKDVSYPQGAVLPENVIPQNYKDWYIAMFEGGKRIPPPLDLVAVINVVPMKTTVQSGNLFNIFEYGRISKEVVGDVSGLYLSDDQVVCITNKKVYNFRTGFYNDINQESFIGFSERHNIALMGMIDNNNMGFTDITNIKPVPHKLPAESAMCYDGRIYIKNEGSISEVEILDTISVLPHPIARVVAKVMPNATKLYDGCAIQNILGKCYVNIFPKPKFNYQLQLNEIKGQVVDAKYDNKILMVVTNESSKYNRYIFTINDQFNKYDARIIEDINYNGLNFVVLPNGVCINVNEDDSIEIFNKNNIKVLTDPVTHGIILHRCGSDVVFSKNNRFYQLKVK